MLTSFFTVAKSKRSTGLIKSGGWYLWQGDMLSINDEYRFIIEAGTQPGIERERDGGEFVLKVNRQVRTLGHILT